MLSMKAKRYYSIIQCEQTSMSRAHVHKPRSLSRSTLQNHLTSSFFVSVAREIFSDSVVAFCISINMQVDPDFDSDWDLQIEQLLSNRVPPSTVSSNQWGVNSFNLWLSGSEFKCEFSDFDSIPLTRLNYLLEIFLVESNTSYKSQSMYSLIQGINRHLKNREGSDDEDPVDLLKSKRFTHFRNVFDGWINYNVERPLILKVSSS